MLALKRKYLSLNIKSDSGKDLLLTLTIGFIAFAAAANLIMRTSYHGLLFGADTVDYLSTAESLTSGKGFRTYSHYLSLYHPPLYPLLLAFLNILGMDVQDASRVINIVALGLITLLTGNWLKRYIKSRLLVAGTVAIMVTSHILNSVALFAMTETLFILLILLALLQLDTFLNQRNSMIPLSLSALFAVLATLTRWTGISVIFATVILVIFDKRISIKSRMQYTVFYGSITLIPLSIYWAYIRAILGTSVVTQTRLSEFTSFHYLWVIVESLYGWLFVPESGNIHALTIDFIEIEPMSSFDRSIIVLWFVVFMIILITSISNRNNNTCKKYFLSEAVQYRSQSGTRSVFLFITFILIYLLTLYISLILLLLLFGNSPGILYRFLSPIYTPILVCVVLVCEWFFRQKFGGMRPILFKFVFVALIAFGCVIHINRAVQWNISLTVKALEYNNYNPYIRGYTPNSPIIEYLNNNRLEGDIFVSYIPILYRLTDVMPPVRPINCSDQFNQFTDSTPSHKEKIINPIYIILFTKVPNYENCSLQDLALQNPHLDLIVETSELIVETSDGLIYKINSASQT